MQKHFDRQYANANSRHIRKEQNYQKATGGGNQIRAQQKKQGMTLPNLAIHKKSMLENLSRK